MKSGFRTAMTWLHDWSGLVIGWLLFAIALAGSLSVFRTEIGDWSRPEAACCAADAVTAGADAVAWLSVHAAHSSSWYIRPADMRSATSYVFWIEPKASGGYIQKWLSAKTGTLDGIRDTLGGEFFYRLHFELELPYPWGRVLSGSAAVVMLLALLTGIVAHRRFFADFFTFRPGKGQRSWLDAHNLFGVAALPFHLIITFTGALTLSTLLMPWGGLSAYKGDSAALNNALYPASIERPATGRFVPLAPIRPMLEAARRRFNGDLFDISIANPGDIAAVVILTRAEDARIGVQAERLSFEGATGRLLAAHDERRPGVATYNILYALHTARYAPEILRWVYFLSGLLLTASIGTGLMLWAAKRAGRQRGRGFAIVERLNVGFISGTPIAFAAFFLANRLLPIAMNDRAQDEVDIVFWTWALVLLWGGARKPRKAWRELPAMLAIMLAAIPIIDLAIGAMRAGIDLTALFLASVSAWVALRKHVA